MDAATTVEVTSGVLRVAGKLVPTRYPVAQACLTGGHLVVLYDPEADPRRWGTFPNLASVAADGTERWLADTAETTTGDHFTRITSCDPLLALAWSGYHCRVDAQSGRLVEKTFTK